MSLLIQLQAGFLCYFGSVCERHSIKINQKQLLTSFIIHFLFNQINCIWYRTKKFTLMQGKLIQKSAKYLVQFNCPWIIRRAKKIAVNSNSIAVSAGWPAQSHLLPNLLFSNCFYNQFYGRRAAEGCQVATPEN